MSPYAFLKGKNLIKNGKNARRKECSAYAIVCRYLMDISYLAEILSITSLEHPPCHLAYSATIRI